MTRTDYTAREMGSLFSGIGGLELGLEAAGFGPVRWQVEIDPFCRQVLAKHWPDADRTIADVREAGAATLPRVDLICGGFPCQDVSAAGKGAGLEGARSGLWYEFRRIIGELRPRLTVIENVASGAARWLPEVRQQLCELGYDTAALAVSAADIGAPHRRGRVFVVGALADADRAELRHEQGRRSGAGWRGARLGADVGEAVGNAHIVDGAQGRAFEDRGEATRPTRRADRGVAQPRVGRDVHGFPARLDGHQWPAGRGPEQHPHEPSRTVPSRTVPDRAARVSALGNAVVPQCALVVGRWIRAQIDAGRIAA